MAANVYDSLLGGHFLHIQHVIVCACMIGNEYVRMTIKGSSGNHQESSICRDVEVVGSGNIVN